MRTCQCIEQKYSGFRRVRKPKPAMQQSLVMPHTLHFIRMSLQASDAHRGRTPSNAPSVRSLEPPLPDDLVQQQNGAAPIPHHLYTKIPKHLLLPDGTPNYLPMILTARVYDVVQATPLTYATSLSTRMGCKISLKREDLQPVFSFKCRGAYNCIAQLSKEDKERGVVACSAGEQEKLRLRLSQRYLTFTRIGNHAQGVALACSKLGITSTIVMPMNTPSIKFKNVQRLGSNVLLHGENFDAAKAECARLEREKGWTNIPPYDDPFVIAGQATVAVEILRQLDNLQELDAVFVCVGGGGLLAGIATYIKAVAPPHVKVIGVETVDADALTKSLAAGKRVLLDEVGLFADGTAVRIVGEECWRLLSAGIVDDMILVNNDEVCAAIKDIFEDTRSVPEPSGALAVAGMKRYIQEHDLQGSGKTFVGLVSGANMNFDRLRFVAERAELGEGREVLLSVVIPERPGAFLDLHSQINPRTVTGFSYRYSSPAKADIYLSFHLSGKRKRQEEIDETISAINKMFSKDAPTSDNITFGATDISNNELAKAHARYLIGGRNNVEHERLYRFEFPERPNALRKFLEGLKSGWNISLFHYRFVGGDLGKVLTGFQVPAADEAEFEAYLRDLDYRAIEETDNVVAKRFLSGAS